MKPLPPLEPLTNYPIASINHLIDVAYCYAPGNVVHLFRNNLYGLRDESQRLLSRVTDHYLGVIKGLLKEIRELKEENAALRAAIAQLQNPETIGGLGDK